MRLHLNQDQQAEEHRRHKHLPCEYKSFPYLVVIQDQNVIASMWLEPALRLSSVIVSAPYVAVVYKEQVDCVPS